MSLVEQLRNAAGSAGDRAASLTLDERIVSAIPGAEPDTGTSQERYKLWRESQNGKRPTEYLLPRIVREVECAWPPFMRRAARGMPVEDLRAKLAELGPWYVPFALGDPVVNTMEFTDNFGAAIFADDNAQRMQFRTELIGGTLGRLLGDELARDERARHRVQQRLVQLRPRRAGRALGRRRRPAGRTTSNRRSSSATTSASTTRTSTSPTRCRSTTSGAGTSC